MFIRGCLVFLLVAFLCSYSASAQVINPASANIPRYPVFEIPLGGSWVDFELKATTNNFLHGTENDGLLLWVDSLGALRELWTTHPAANPSVQIYWAVQHISAGVNDARQIEVWSSATSLSTQTGATSDLRLNPANVTVCVTPETRGGSAVWLRPDNDAVSWVFCRKSLSDHELNLDGSWKWQTIRPVEWRARPLSMK